MEAVKGLNALELDEGCEDSVRLPEVEFITGAAGTGKTHTVRARIAADPGYGVLAATTGIAAVNLGLGAITINSLLRYFDTEDLERKFIEGTLTRTMVDLVKHGIRRIIVDEVSMLPAEQLDLLHKAATQVSAYLDPRSRKGERLPPLHIVLTGDFCQLPPVKAKWAFEAENWPRFQANTTRLTKIWRQDDPTFLEALNAARRGEGGMAVELLQELGVAFGPGVNAHFEGTTIVPTNQEVERINYARMLKLPGRARSYAVLRWGTQRPEWRWNEMRGTGIPDVATFKEGALVMILANDPEFTYVNGDLGHIEGFEKSTAAIRLMRDGKLVYLKPIYRKNTTFEIPEGVRDYPLADTMSEPYYDEEEHRWVMGGIVWMPMRVAYATTVHKSQGLSLDSVQVDCRAGFFGQPNMAYVALSRVRTPEGLRIVGTPEVLAKRITVAPEVVRWL